MPWCRTEGKLSWDDLYYKDGKPTVGSARIARHDCDDASIGANLHRYSCASTLSCRSIKSRKRRITELGVRTQTVISSSGNFFAVRSFLAALSMETNLRRGNAKSGPPGIIFYVGFLVSNWDVGVAMRSRARTHALRWRCCKPEKRSAITVSYSSTIVASVVRPASVIVSRRLRPSSGSRSVLTQCLSNGRRIWLKRSCGKPNMWRTCACDAKPSVLVNASTSQSTLAASCVTTTPRAPETSGK